MSNNLCDGLIHAAVTVRNTIAELERVVSEYEQRSSMNETKTRELERVVSEYEAKTREYEVKIKELERVVSELKEKLDKYEGDKIIDYNDWALRDKYEYELNVFLAGRDPEITLHPTYEGWKSGYDNFENYI